MPGYSHLHEDLCGVVEQVYQFLGEMSIVWNCGAGQTHLNSDAKIADEGHPQGAPLPIVFFFRPRNRPPVAKDVWNLR